MNFITSKIIENIFPYIALFLLNAESIYQTKIIRNDQLKENIVSAFNTIKHQNILL